MQVLAGTLGPVGATRNYFSPLSLSPALWLDAGQGTFQDAGVTAATADGDVIGQWRDLSGNNQHATQVTTAAKPVLRQTTNNGKTFWVVEFDGANDGLTLPTLAVLTAGEVFCVVKTDADPVVGGASSGLWVMGTAPNWTHYTWTDGILYDSFGTNSRKTTGNPTPLLSSWNVYHVWSAANDWANHLNGTQLFQTATNTAAFPATPQLGTAASLYYLDGRIALFLLYPRKLTTSERASVLGYISGKYGITVA